MKPRCPSFISASRNSREKNGRKREESIHISLLKRTRRHRRGVEGGREENKVKLTDNLYSDTWWGEGEKRFAVHVRRRQGSWHNKDDRGGIEKP